jgi:hypothetical protein
MLWLFKARYCSGVVRLSSRPLNIRQEQAYFLYILPTCFPGFELHVLPFRALKFGEYQGLEIIMWALYAGMGSKLVPKSLGLEPDPPDPPASNFILTDNSIGKARSQFGAFLLIVPW